MSSLQERIAKLNAAAQGSSKAAPAALPPGELRKRREAFENSESDAPLLPRGSFGLGAPSTNVRSLVSDRNRVASASSSSYVPNTGFEPKLRSSSSNAALNRMPSGTTTPPTQTSTPPSEISAPPTQFRDPPDAAGLRGKALLHDHLNLANAQSIGVQESGLMTPGSVSSMNVEAASSQGTVSAVDIPLEESSHAPERPHTPISERDAAITPTAVLTPTTENAPQVAVLASDEERAALTAERLQEYEDEETDITRKPDADMLSPTLPGEEIPLDDVQKLEEKVEALKVDVLEPTEQDPIIDTNLVETNDHDDGRLTPVSSPTKNRERQRRVSSASSTRSSRRASRIVPEPQISSEEGPETDLGDSSLDKMDNPTPEQTPQFSPAAQFPSQDEDGEEKEDIEDLHVRRDSLIGAAPTEPTRTAHSSGDPEFPATVSEEGHATYDILDSFGDAEPELPVDASEDDNPKVKCSDCGVAVGLLDLGEHVCSPIVKSPSTSSNIASPVKNIDSGSLAAGADLPRDISRRDLDSIANNDDSPMASPLDTEFPRPPVGLPYQPSSTTLPSDRGNVHRKTNSMRSLDSPTSSAANSPTVALRRGQYPPHPFDDEDDYTADDGAQGYATIIKRV